MATLFSNNNDHNDDEEFLRSLPPGYRFIPCDHELITYYLRRKVEGKNLPPNLMHDDIYLYDHCPFQLTDSYKAQGENVWYFFTKRVRKYANGPRPSRATGNGFWKKTAGNKVVKDTQGREIGYKNVSTYFLGKSSDGGVKTPLQMHEYLLNDDSENRDRNSARAKIPKTNKAVGANSSNGSDSRTRFLDGLVLCKIYYSKNNNKNNNNNDDDDDDDDGSNAQYQELEGEDTQEFQEPEPTFVNNIQHDHPPKISETFISNNTNNFQTYYDNNSTINFDNHGLTQENYLVPYPCAELPPDLMYELDQTTLDYDGNMYQNLMNCSSFDPTDHQDIEIAQSWLLSCPPSGSSVIVKNSLLSCKTLLSLGTRRVTRLSSNINFE